MVKKVCIVSISLGKGGLERFCANLSCLLSDYGYEIHLVVLNDEIDYQYKGELFNLGKLKTSNDSLWKRLKRFKTLRDYFNQKKFDYILDNRIGNLAWRELFYRLYIYGLGSKVVYIQHSGNIAKHFPNPSLISKYLIEYAYAIVGVSRKISIKFNYKYKTVKCQTIYNFIEPVVSSKNIFSYSYKYILLLGRIEENVKNISLLLSAYKKSSLMPNYRLVIMGSGEDETLVKNKIKELKLYNDVILKPFNSDIYQILSGAHYLVLTSRYEGFPMVLVEALSVGTPVVSVDCESGPSEIIVHEQNGLLVENNNVQALVEAMNRMINDNELYKRCKTNAKSSIGHLSREKIIQDWVEILR